MFYILLLACYVSSAPPSSSSLRRTSAQTSHALVPNTLCKAADDRKLCFEGALTIVSNVQSQNTVNECNGAKSTIRTGTCKEFGFEKDMGNSNGIHLYGLGEASTDDDNLEGGYEKAEQAGEEYIAASEAAAKADGYEAQSTATYKEPASVADAPYAKESAAAALDEKYAKEPEQQFEQEEYAALNMVHPGYGVDQAEIGLGYSSCASNADCGHGVCVKLQCQCNDGWYTPEPHSHGHVQRMAVKTNAYRFLQYVTAAAHSAYPAAAATAASVPYAQSAAASEPYAQSAAAAAPGFHGAYNVQNSKFRYQQAATSSSTYKDDDDHYGLHHAANGYDPAIHGRILPCSVERPDQLTAFLLQLFFGGFGAGCFYLGHGWVSLGVWCLLFIGLVCCFFPCVVCCMACGLDSIVACLTAPCRAVAVCFGCATPKRGKNHQELNDWEEVEQVQNTRFRNCFVILFTLTGLIIWIYSLYSICNHCYIHEDGVMIPCQPMHSSVCT